MLLNLSGYSPPHGVNGGTRWKLINLGIHEAASGVPSNDYGHHSSVYPIKKYSFSPYFLKVNGFITEDGVKVVEDRELSQQEGHGAEDAQK